MRVVTKNRETGDLRNGSVKMDVENGFDKKWGITLIPETLTDIEVLRKIYEALYKLPYHIIEKTLTDAIQEFERRQATVGNSGIGKFASQGSLGQDLYWYRQPKRWAEYKLRHCNRISIFVWSWCKGIFQNRKNDQRKRFGS